MNISCNVIFVQANELTDDNRHNQMTAKARFRKFGQKLVAAIVKKFTQLNEGAVPGKPAMIPTDATSMTSLKRKKALRAVNLIKDKRSGDLKVCTCADGSGQRFFLK